MPRRAIGWYVWDKNGVVHVHRFRCKGTIEEVLDQILARKSEAFANIVDALASGAHLSEMESTELLNEVLGEIDPASTLSVGKARVTG